MSHSFKTKIETAKNQYPHRDYEVNISIPEFTCVCPKTSLPDFATINIQYIPDKLLVELKSLKLYCVEYRDLGIFHEHVANKILDDFIGACSPKKIIVTAIFNTRGGINTTVKASWPN